MHLYEKTTKYISEISLESFFTWYSSNKIALHANTEHCYKFIKQEAT
jgi:hypothetical protein